MATAKSVACVARTGKERFASAAPAAGTYSTTSSTTPSEAFPLGGSARAQISTLFVSASKAAGAKDNAGNDPGLDARAGNAALAPNTAAILRNARRVRRH